MFASPFQSLIELLRIRAVEDGDKTAFTFLGRATTYSQLWVRINQFALELLKSGLPRFECVLIGLPNGEDFFTAFYGVQRAGGIPVPLFPESGEDRFRSIAAQCKSHWLILSPEKEKSFWEFEQTKDSDDPIKIISILDTANEINEYTFPEITSKEVAFIQYTSGSTGNPNGIAITHHNLLTNISQMIAGMELSSQDIFVSWLPIYHDMGLILMTMTPLFLAAKTHLLPTNISQLPQWLREIEARRATFTAAPDFAYRLCLRLSEKKSVPDLSSLRVALNAAEPVRSSTVKAFEGLYGLTHVMTAGYGLAEATVGVSMSTPGAALRMDKNGFVSVGRPFPGIEIQIVDQGRILPQGVKGEIAVRSAANTNGYIQNPGETLKTFTSDGLILTGDLGYLDEDGNLYIIGRKKSVIKRFGESIAPQEIEEVVDQLPGVRFSAALGIDRGGIEGEQIYIFAETHFKKDRGETSLIELIHLVVEAVYSRMGFRPGRVYLVKPHTIPRTYNGKLQHLLLKQRYLDRSLQSDGLILYPDF